ncbi:MAG: ROK family protein [Thermoflavifilum sp.]|jgi:glucokinase|uniref:ROK family protein n=1 Tax=Thermoflavifilum sp. TaxID=1968839 RepID=UPI0018A3FE8B|nr:ROK family protein [Thermoflavifilum sp.]QOR76092.1 MAG: ROK family protein [Thermoflavifilum sp.]
MKQPLAVGIDIGGTNTTFGIVDRRGNLLYDGHISTRDHQEVSFFIQALYDQLAPLIQKVTLEGGEVKGIGVGVPNGNYFKGTIEFAPNLPWRGVVPLASLIQDAFTLPTVLTNDANAAAIGEMTYGAARGMKDFIMITLGTGLGSGIVVNGQLVYGHDGFAGELGHVIVFPEGRRCGCGRKGCLETYVSATGIVRTMHELLQSRHIPSLLRDMNPTAITSKTIRDAALKGDALAIEAFEFTGKILGQQLANFVAFSSPEAIILFGGLTRAGDLIFRPTIHAMEENLLQIYKNKIKVLPSELKESDAAILGASALVWEIKN